jgi:hypothetical protein
VVAEEVPECAEDDVRKRRVGVGEVRDQPAVVVKVQRSGDVVAAFIPKVGEAEEGEVGEDDREEEKRIEDRGWGIEV